MHINWNDRKPITAREGETTPLRWSCAACGEANETLLDMTGGYQQEYVEDCVVCCRPNVLRIRVDPGTYTVGIENAVE